MYNDTKFSQFVTLYFREKKNKLKLPAVWIGVQNIFAD